MVTPPKQTRRWRQFSLRSLLALVLVASVALSWLGVGLRRARQQRHAIDRLRQLRARVYYDYEYAGEGKWVHDAELPGPAWLRELLGEDFFIRPRLIGLGGSNIDDSSMPCFECLTELRSLDLVETRITDAGLMHLSGLTKLEELLLWGNDIGDAGLAHLESLKDLKRLSLSDTRMTDAGLAHLAGLTKLQWLCLCENRISDAGLIHLKRLTDLRTLTLDDTLVTDDGLIHLRGLRSLETLWLNRTKVTDAGLVHLKPLKGLVDLDLIGTRVTRQGASALQDALPNTNILHSGIPRIPGRHSGAAFRHSGHSGHSGDTNRLWQTGKDSLEFSADGQMASGLDI